MNKVFEMYAEIINKIGLLQTIKYIVIILGIMLIYLRVFKNFKYVSFFPKTLNFSTT